jgi:hypothetical protein
VQMSSSCISTREGKKNIKLSKLENYIENENRIDKRIICSAKLYEYLS